MNKIYMVAFLTIFTFMFNGCAQKLLYTDDKINNLGILSILGNEFEAAYRDRDQNSVITKVHDNSSWNIDDFIEQDAKEILNKYTSYNIKTIDSTQMEFEQYYKDRNESDFNNTIIKEVMQLNGLDHLIVIERGDYLPDDDIDIVGVGLEKVKVNGTSKLVAVVNIYIKKYALLDNELKLLDSSNITVKKRVDDKLWVDTNRKIESQNLYKLEKIIKDLLKKRVIVLSLKELGFVIYSIEHSKQTSNSYE